MSNKKTATHFLKMAASGHVQEAYEKFIAPNFIHHNLYFKGDRQSLLNAMQQASINTPNKSIDVVNVYEDGNTVITHSHVVRKANDTGITVVHIFKFENNRIIELWDVGAEIPQDSPNEHGAF